MVYSIATTNSHSNKIPAGLVLVGLILLISAGPVQAVDGVIEINQSRALAGISGTSDTPGFPVTLDQPGSYRLTGNLEVSDPDTVAIEVTVNHVTVDLNGFAILGPGSGTGLGDGVQATLAVDYVVVKNGMVKGVGGHGVSLRSFSRVERVHAISNGFDGISLNISGLVTHSIAHLNGGAGIRVGNDATVSFCVARSNQQGIVAEGHSTLFSNTANENISHGIAFFAGSTVRGNTSYSNGGDGFNEGGTSGSLVMENTASSSNGSQLVLGSNSGYGRNVITDPFNKLITGGVSMGGNLCNGAAC